MNTGSGTAWKARLEAGFNQIWWQVPPRAVVWLLRPLSGLYGLLLGLNGWFRRAHRFAPQALPVPVPVPVPVLVVGNWVVGGAGKTPTVVAIVQALQRRGHRPGVISRGHGRAGNTSDDGIQEVLPTTPVELAGDEPVLIQRRCGVPVWVGARRAEVAAALCRAHPEVDVLVSDDGLQHHALHRQAELVVFDERGAGNGFLLPAGPLRQPLPLALAAATRVLYTAGCQTTHLSGSLAQRSIDTAWPLTAWHAGEATQADEPDQASQPGQPGQPGQSGQAARAAQAGQPGKAVPLSALKGQKLLAVAGMAAPEKFFQMLHAAGLNFQRLPLPDHHAYVHLPWPEHTLTVITTEKDAVKLDPQRMGATAVWVVPLNLVLPDELIVDLHHLLFPTAPP